MNTPSPAAKIAIYEIPIFYSVSFASPAVANDFLSYMFREQFILANPLAKDKGIGCLIDGFERVSPFEVKAPERKWKNLFQYFKNVTPSAVNHRTGMLIFCVYMNMRNFKSMKGFEYDFDPFADDVVLERRKLFEACMDDIVNVEETVVENLEPVLV